MIFTPHLCLPRSESGVSAGVSHQLNPKCFPPELHIKLHIFLLSQTTARLCALSPPCKCDTRQGHFLITRWHFGVGDGDRAFLKASALPTVLGGHSPESQH